MVREDIGQNANAMRNTPDITPGERASSSWEQPITDTQAIEISNCIFSKDEEHAYFSEEEAATAPGPAWEQTWFKDRTTDTWYYAPQYPHKIEGSESGDSNWEAWLAEVTTVPPPNYYYLDRI